MKDDRPAWKTIGVLGGMGPEATAEFYRRIIGICQRDYGATYDSDFPPMFIYNLPLPDIVENGGDGECITKLLKDGIDKLESAGCDLVAVPCNTAVYFINGVCQKIPTLNIIEETLSEAKKRKFKKVGILSTSNTARNKLYESVFDGIEILQPSEPEKERINEIILRILSGLKKPEDKAYLQSVSGKLAKNGAEAVILGCTDLPLLISQKDCDIKLLDTLQILAETTVKKAGGEKNGV